MGHTQSAASVAPQQSTPKVTGILLVSLALLSAAAPLATDMYLPTFPQMVTDLHTSTTGVQLSLTSFFVGAGLGQVLFGPLSDRLGRRLPLLVGSLIYVAVSAAAAMSPTITLLVIARFVQGLSGAAGMVIGRAVISDLTEGRQAARAFSLLMLVGGIAPVIAPLIGGVMANSLGWRGVLWIVASVGALALLAAVFFVKESRPASARQDSGQKMFPVRVLMNRRFLGNGLAYAFAFVTMMAYISASPFLYQTMMGLTELQYAGLFGVNALVLAAVGGASARLTRTHSPALLARLGLAISLASIVVLAVMVALSVPALWLALPIPFAVGSLGLVFGNATALALAEVREVAGLGSAMLGLMQFVLAGIVSPLVSLGGGTSAVPLVITMLTASVLANLLFLFAGHRRTIAESITQPVSDTP